MAKKSHFGLKVADLCGQRWDQNIKCGYMRNTSSPQSDLFKLCTTDLNKLDAICNRYIKKWTGVPKCGTNLVFQMDYIQYNHSMRKHIVWITLPWGWKVILDNAIERESQLARKAPQYAEQRNCTWQLSTWTVSWVNFPSPWWHWDRKKEKLTRKTKNTVKYIAKAPLTKGIWTLMKQGEFLKLAQIEGQDPMWSPSYGISLWALQH